MTTSNEPQHPINLEQDPLRVNPAKTKTKPVKTYHRTRDEKTTIQSRIRRDLLEELKTLDFDPRETIELLVQTLIRRTHKSRGLPARLDLYPRASIARDTRLSRVLQGDSLSPENLERLSALNRKAKRVARRKAELEREGKL